ncbi:MAG: hypothetical protein MJ145_05065 [Clostridia bacterium]|nr:hypothetical protein [Clostridia bacterium]
MNEFAHNLTTTNIVIFLTSIPIAIFFIRQAIAGVFVKYKWVLFVAGIFFLVTYLKAPIGNLYLLPFTIFLCGTFLFSLLIGLNVIKPKEEWKDERMEEVPLVREKDMGKKNSYLGRKRRQKEWEEQMAMEAAQAQDAEIIEGEHMEAETVNEEVDPNAHIRD